MGGNALKNCVTKRLTADEYNALSSEVLRILALRFPSATFSPIISYRNKADFGDLDILFKVERRFSEVDVPSPSVIKQAFGSKEIVKNGNVISFEFQEFQVDLILTSWDTYMTSVNYFAYNDLGNLMGRIASKMGFTYGHRGLVYKYRSSDSHMVKEILVSSSAPTIFEFLGYNYLTFYEGFDELEDILEYVVSSPYFHKDIYLLENRNAVSRVRDKKRKTYNEFLKYLEGKHGFPEYKWASMNERGITRSVEHLYRAFRTFPEFQEGYEAVREQVDKYEKFKGMFNGGLVRELTGLQERELGNLMSSMRTWGEQCLEGSLQDHILKLETPEKIEYFIKDFATRQKGFTL